MKKNVPMIANDGEHTRKMEGGVCSFQLFSWNHEADRRIALHASNSRANVVVLLKDRHFYIYLHLFHVHDNKRICVKKLTAVS